MDQRTTDLLFQKITIHYSRFLPTDINLINIMKQSYFEILKEYDVELVSKNFKNHLVTSNYLPTVADLVKSDKHISDTIGVQETILMIEQTEKETTPIDKPSSDYIREQIEKAKQKITGVKLNELERKFNRTD